MYGASKNITVETG